MKRFVQGILRNQRGQVLVLAVFIFVVIIGFVGLAFDVWQIVYHKQKLQEAIDLAALAAIQEAVNHGQVQSTAVEFAKMNGLIPGEIKVIYPYQGDTNRVQIIGERKLKLTFLPVLGYRTTTVSAKTVAKVTYTAETSIEYAALDYAVFSGSVDVHLDIKGNYSVINGNVHGNKNVNFHGTGHVINGNLEASGGKFGGETKVTVSGIKDKIAPVLPMPDMGFNELANQADLTFEGDQIFNNVDINGIWLINGSAKLNGGRITGRGIILATNGITLAGNRFEYSSSNDLLALYSLTDITISSTRANIHGVLYAPNGEIKISGSDNTFYGALIANTIWWAQTGFTINGDYDVRAPQAFTIQKPSYRLDE